jgi:hypothetical protein
MKRKDLYLILSQLWLATSFAIPDDRWLCIISAFIFWAGWFAAWWLTKD